MQYDAVCLSLWASFLALVRAAPIDNGTQSTMDLLMPGNKPTAPDTYSCLPFKLDQDHALYITGFIPHAEKKTAHHVLIYGCAEPGSEEGIWNCGEMTNPDDGPVCKSGSQIIYAWAMDAPSLTLPQGAAFKVGGNTGVNWLVLQVHYMDVSSFLPPLNLADNSGITLVTTLEPQPHRAGTYLLGTGGSIPAQSTVYMETACEYQDPEVMHPFAFRTHTHSHGKVVSGYRVRDGEWKEIGRMSPQKPQMFYNVTDPDMTIQDGDFVAARCTMVNDEDRDIEIGMTHNDEMCNFYIMYYVDGDQIPESRDCWRQGPPGFHWNKVQAIRADNAPSEASVVPGSNDVIPQQVSETVVEEQSYSEGDLSDDQMAAIEAYLEELREIEEQDEEYAEALLEQALQSRDYAEPPSWSTDQELFQRAMRAQEEYYPYDREDLLREYYNQF